MTASQGIPGYSFGSSRAARSPLGDDDFAALRQTLMWSGDDEAALRKAGEVLADQIEDVLDVWYDFVGSLPQLVAAFEGPDGKPDETYLTAVRARFGQWIRDLCHPPYGRGWLDYQEEIGLRHTSAKKNQTDDVTSSADHVPLRYIVTLIYPITATIRDFLGRKGHSYEEVEAMHQAWFKAVVLTVALWARPYADEW
jgi:hypothetical protein